MPIPLLYHAIHNILTYQHAGTLHSYLAEGVGRSGGEGALEHSLVAMYTGHLDGWKNLKLIYKILCFVMYDVQ